MARDFEAIAREQACQISELASENAMLKVEIATLKEQNAKLREVIAELEGRIADLERRLGRNPRNSSVPPSAEGLAKPPAKNRAQRRGEKRRPGKQPGAEGFHLAQVADPDERIVHRPERCRSCGEDLAEADVVAVETRQVFEVPRIEAHVTEHQMLRLRCGCGCETKAAPPPEATAPACYGPGVRALAVYLSVYQHVPYERCAELFSDVLSLPVSEGAIVQMVEGAGGGLGYFCEVIRDLLRDAAAVNFDETGARVAGRLHWVHAATSALYTLLIVHEKRGTPAMDALGVIGAMQGIACHDGWKPYRSYDVVHALCNAHHARELDGIASSPSQAWADEMGELLLDALEVVEAAKDRGAGRLDDSTLHSIRTRYGILIAKGWAANPEPAHGKRHGVNRDAANLLARLDGYRDDVLRFTENFEVSYSNNQAERDIRMVKLQQKISGGWRTLDGAQSFLRIRSYVATMKKHGHNVLDGLRDLFMGDVWLPNPVPRT